MNNHLFENPKPSIFYDFEKKNILWSFFFNFSFFVFSFITIIYFFQKAFELFFLLPFFILITFFIFNCIKNIIRWITFKKAFESLESESFELTIFFILKRRLIGIKVMFITFLIIVFNYAIFMNIFINFNSTSFSASELEMFFSLLLILSLYLIIVFVLRFHFMNKQLKEAEEIIFLTDFLEVEIMIEAKQAIKDYLNLIIIFLSFLFILPGLLILISSNFRNKILL